MSFLHNRLSPYIVTTVDDFDNLWKQFLFTFQVLCLEKNCGMMSISQSNYSRIWFCTNIFKFIVCDSDFEATTCSVCVSSVERRDDINRLCDFELFHVWRTKHELHVANTRKMHDSSSYFLFRVRTHRHTLQTLVITICHASIRPTAGMDARAGCQGSWR